jgi:hypothetical protein
MTAKEIQGTRTPFLHIGAIYQDAAANIAAWLEDQAIDWSR